MLCAIGCVLVGEMRLDVCPPFQHFPVHGRYAVKLFSSDPLRGQYLLSLFPISLTILLTQVFSRFLLVTLAKDLPDFQRIISLSHSLFLLFFSSAFH